MNHFSFNPAGDARESADATLNNYQLLLHNYSDWVVEAEGDTVKQAMLLEADYNPAMWLQLHFIHSATSHDIRTRALIKTARGAKEAPRQMAANEAIETILDYLETMPAASVDALVSKMIAEIDAYDMEQFDMERPEEAVTTPMVTGDAQLDLQIALGVKWLDASIPQHETGNNRLDIRPELLPALRADVVEAEEGLARLKTTFVAKRETANA